MTSRRLTIYVVLAIVFLFGSARVYYRLTDDFRLSNMTYDFSHESFSWPVIRLSSEEQQGLTQLLGQTFHYIGKGAQCYAFVSEDGEYVLKFFKFKHLKPNWLVQFIPPVYPFKEYKETIIEKKRRKLQGVFEGYDLAYRENKEDSELIYLHLMPTNHLQQYVTVIDKMGFEHHINLDDVVFLVQKKGETLRTRLNRELGSKDVTAAEASIAKILDMYRREYQKGVYDRDHGVLHNTGFVHDQPFHLDVGKFTQDDRMRQVEFYKKDLEHIVWKIDTWVKQNYPHYHATLTKFLTRQYKDYTGDDLDIASIDPYRFKKRKH